MSPLTHRDQCGHLHPFRRCQRLPGDRNAFTSYTSIGDEEEHVYLGDFITTSVLGEKKVLMKLTSRKTLALTHVLGTFKSDKIVMTKNIVFVGKGYCDQGLFVLNISEIINESPSSSAYLIDLYDMWHARLGPLNSSYLFTMKNL